MLLKFFLQLCTYQYDSIVRMPRPYHNVRWKEYKATLYEEGSLPPSLYRATWPLCMLGPGTHMPVMHAPVPWVPYGPSCPRMLGPGTHPHREVKGYCSEGAAHVHVGLLR